MRGFRGLGQDGTMVGPLQYGQSAADYTVAMNGPGMIGPLQPGQSATDYLNAMTPAVPTDSFASLFPGIAGSSTNWLVPAALIAGAFVLYKIFTK
jgi:hypothetical protein